MLILKMYKEISKEVSVKTLPENRYLRSATELRT
jgi:hypothetical protein